MVLKTLKHRCNQIAQRNPEKTAEILNILKKCEYDFKKCKNSELKRMRVDAAHNELDCLVLELN
jgi:hypothetical protein